MKQPLTVLGFGSVAPYNRAQDVAIELPKLDLALLERTLRRGLSEVTRLFMHAAKLALDDARLQAEPTHVIFASAFGEIGTAEALLAEAYDQNGSSPARFRNSVHNTAAGLLSISSNNHLPCTAVAAGWETVPMALFEAAGQLASRSEPVLLVFAEERVPSALSAEHPHGPLAAAFVLARDERPGGRSHGRLVNLRRAARPVQQWPADKPAVELDPELDQHPLASVLALCDLLTRAQSGTLALGEGELPWCVDVQAGVQS